MRNEFVYGKDWTDRVVSIEVDDTGTITLFREPVAGATESCEVPGSYWALAPDPRGNDWRMLDGPTPLKWYKEYATRRDLVNARRSNSDLFTVYDAKEQALVASGITYFKGMRREDVSVLAFDIESTGLEHNRDSKVLLISNTFRRGAVTERKLFAHDDYPDAAAMFDAWTAWVRDRNPALVVGHNIYGYDLPYMAYCARRAGTRLTLGRDGSALFIPDYESKYRKDGSQFYTYRNAKIYGREIVDTFFLSMKYDIGRKYENYRLKYLVAAEGLEVANRQHYDAALISRNHTDPVEWAKIKAYATHDADDALALFDRMGSAYFYLAQAVPKSFQQIINGASGSWLNAFLVRSYLSIGHSVPAADEAKHYEGAISIGNAGVYRNVYKVDVASLYPSIILQYQVHDPAKDPRGHFLRMVEHFTAERLANKRLAKETNDLHYSDLEQAQKIVINSAYGMLGTPGLNFNSPANAELITSKGRQILTDAMQWAERNEMTLVNADTDSISVASKRVAGPWSAHDQESMLAALNDISPERIRWENDGIYDVVVVLKAKNYALRKLDSAKVKTKGSALKGTTKERALQEFMNGLIRVLMDSDDAPAAALDLYNDYVFEIHNLADISRWTSKKTVTEAILNPSRTNEQKVADALAETDVQMGDKHYFFFDTNDALVLQQNWTGNHSVERLLEKLFKTVKIFAPVLDIKLFPNYTLKRNQRALSSLLTGQKSA